MARKISIAAIITLMCVLMSCQSNYQGASDVLPDRITTRFYPGEFVSANATETDIIELVEKSRTDYKKSMEALVDYYSRTGNNEKYNNAKDELYALNTMTQYEYLNVLIVDGIEPTTLIPDADLLYESAILDIKKAEKNPIFPNKNLYRSALTKFKQLIKVYRKSDKVDDSAYKAGEISETLKDYTAAYDFYSASFKWDPYTPYPARLKAARILDKYKHNYSEALELYKLGLEREAQLESKYYEVFKNAKDRVSTLEKKNLEP